MRSTIRIAHSVRLAAILAAGAFGLHELRYLIGSGGPSTAEHAAHGYMTDLLAPIAVLALAAALATVIRGTEGAAAGRAPLGRRGALFSVYLGQESLESVLTAGHATIVHALIAGGGWLAAPLAIGLGALSALLASALERVEHAIAIAHARRLRSRPPAVRGRALPARGLRLTFAPLAFGLARRPPPPSPT